MSGQAVRMTLLQLFTKFIIQKRFVEFRFDQIIKRFFNFAIQPALEPREVVFIVLARHFLSCPYTRLPGAMSCYAARSVTANRAAPEII